MGALLFLIMNEKVNYDGVKFGMLTVLKDGKGLYEGKKKRRSVVCKCDCGNTKEILLRQIIRNNQKSCGCLAPTKTEVSPGDSFGLWKVIKETNGYFKEGKKLDRAFEVKCACGKHKEINLQSLKTGTSKSCGCQGRIREEKIKKEKILPTDTEEEQWVDLSMDNNYLVSNLGRLFSKKTDKYLTWRREPRIKGNKNISLHKEVYKSFNGDYDKDSYTLIFLDGNTRNRRLDNLYLSYITDNGYNWVMRVRQNLSPNKKGECNSISAKDIVDQYNKQQGLSYFLKIPLDITMKDKLSSVSIDRIDNDKGYTKDNFTLVTRFENMGRNINSFEDMVKFSNEKIACGHL